MATFSDFYNQRASALPRSSPQQTPSAVPNLDFSWLPKPGQSVEEPEPQSPLNWAMDIISRPLFGATTAVSGVLEGIAKDQEGGFGNTAGGIAALPTNFLAGLFDTTDGEGTKNSYGDLMEKYTDRFGEINNPEYVDEKNNVDPVFRGVAGFALDVIADPLTWIPGGLIAKAVKGAGSAAKAGVDAVRGAEKVGDVADVAETVAKTADETPVATKVVDEAENAFGDAARAPKLDVPPVETVKVPDHLNWARVSKDKDLEAKVSKVDKLVQAGKLDEAKLVDAEILDAYTKSLKKEAPEVSVKAPEGYERFISEFRKAPNAPVLREMLQNVQKAVGTSQEVVSPVAKVADTGQAIPASDMGRFAAEAGEVPTQVYDELSVDLQNLLADTKGTGAPASHQRLMSLASKNSPAPDAVRQEARSVLRRQYFEAQSGKQTTELQVLDDIQKSFEYRRASSRSRFNKVLGEPLVNVLSKKSPKAMDSSISNIVDVLDPTADDLAIQRFFEGRNMGQLGSALSESLNIPSYVKPVANTVEEVATVRARIPELQTAADRAVVKTLRTEVTDVKQSYPHVAGNVRYSDLDETVRVGRHTRQLNTFFQYTLVKNLRDDIYRQMERAKGVDDVNKLYGSRRAQAYREAFLEAGDSVSDTLSALGLKMHIGAGHQEKLLPLNVFETYQLVERGFQSEKMALAGLWNFGSAVAPTRLMEAVHTALTSLGKSSDEILEDVRTVLQNKKLSGKRGQVLDRDIPNNALSVKYGNAKGTSLIDPIAQAIVKALPELETRLVDNISNYAARGIDESSSLSNKAIKELQEIVGTDDASAVAAIARIRQGIAEAGEQIGALPSSVEIAADVTKMAVGEDTVKIATSLRTAESKVASGGSRKEAVAKSSQDISDVMTKEADELDELIDQDMPSPSDPSVRPLDVDESVPVIDLASMKADPVLAQQGFVSQALNGFRKTFDQSYGMGKQWDVLHSKKTNGGEFLATTVGHMRELRKLPLSAQVAGMKALQEGVPNTNPEIQAAVKIIQDALRPILETSSNSRSLLNDKIISTEPDLAHINGIFRQVFGQETDFQYELLDDAGKLIDQWRTWEFKDPSKDILKLSMAATRVVEHRAIVGNFVSTMKKSGHISDEPKPGFVRLADSGGSTFGKLMPEGIYVDRGMANELHRLDILTRTDRNLQGEVGEFIRKSFIPMQNVWKQLVTVYRPGHHVRNAMGNSFMSWIDRGNRHWSSSQRDAFRVLGIKNNYSDLDLVDALKSFTDDAMPTGGETIIRGRFGDITAREVFEIFERSGLRSTYAASEDLMLEAGMGKIAKFGEALSNSKVGALAGSASHFIDHQGKLSHLIQILKQEAGGGRYARYGKNLTKQQVIERAVKDVKRSHPDALMLTPAEAKWRWLVPFYTWFAKTAPFALESALRNPGRIAAIPKASYSLAVANGVNPDSIVDPFPEDQLFPSYITEGVFGPQFVGPDGENININPGVPIIDMLKDIGTDPVRGVAGMTSPLFRVPAEMLSGGQWSNGAPIRDMSDYLDQNLPIVNYIANLTGSSVTGSVPSLLSGQGLDPQRQVEAGNKGEIDQALTFSNWFTGLNAQNWSRPNLINYAEIEKRNRESGKTGGF